MYFADSAQGSATWAVVCTCKEPTALLAAFAAHHLSLGASYVSLFLDGPDPETEALLGSVNGVRLTICDGAYWRAETGWRRPRGNEARQIANAARAHAEAEADWLLHLDADEFLETDLPFATILGAMPQAVDYVRLSNVERVFDASRPQVGLFDGHMRGTLPRRGPEQSDILGGPGQTLLRDGMLGHGKGKSAFRTDRKLIPGIHTPRVPPRRKRLSSWPVSKARILHFDGLTAFHWYAKMLRGWSDDDRNDRVRKRLGEARLAQIAAVKGCQSDMTALLALHQSLKAMQPSDLSRMEILGLSRRPNIAPAAALASLGLGDIGLSVDAFDAALAARSPELEDRRLEWRDAYEAYFSHPASGAGETRVISVGRPRRRRKNRGHTSSPVQSVPAPTSAETEVADPRASSRGHA